METVRPETTRLLAQSAETMRREAIRAKQRQEAERGWEREKRAVMWQCVLLSFAGVPVFGLSMYYGDREHAELALAAAFFVSYALPFFRWLAFHMKCMKRDDY